VGSVGWVSVPPKLLEFYALGQLGQVSGRGPLVHSHAHHFQGCIDA
jgi:hypothetical protein